MALPGSASNLRTDITGVTSRAGVHAAHHDALAVAVNASEAALLAGTTPPLAGDIGGTPAATVIGALKVTTGMVAANAITSAKVDGSVEVVSRKGAASGYASLDGSGVLPLAQLSVHTHAVIGRYGGARDAPVTAAWYPAGVVKKAGTATAIRGQVVGGTSVTVQWRKNGATLLLAAPLSVSAGASGAAYTSTTSLQNAACVAGDVLEFQATVVTGVVTTLATQLEITEAD